MWLDDTCNSHLRTISLNVQLYSVSQKSRPLKLFAIFSLVVNLCDWKLHWLSKISRNILSLSEIIAKSFWGLLFDSRCRASTPVLFSWRYEPVRRTGKSDDWITIFCSHTKVDCSEIPIVLSNLLYHYFFIELWHILILWLATFRCWQNHFFSALRQAGWATSEAVWSNKVCWLLDTQRTAISHWQKQ